MATSARRYAWYVHVIQQKVSENWLKYEVDPRITTAKRVYVTFDIARDGHPSNVQIEQSSGVPSLDQSAMRALQRIDTFGPLPSDYSGSKVSVEFWFDYRRSECERYGSDVLVSDLVVLNIRFFYAPKRSTMHPKS